jgi:membrane associated rhomboid family serine protease
VTEYGSFLQRAAAGYIASGYQPLLLPGLASGEWVEGWDQILLGNEPGAQVMMAFTQLPEPDPDLLRQRIDKLVTGLSASGALTAGGVRLIAVAAIPVAGNEKDLRRLTRVGPSIFLTGLSPATWVVDLGRGVIAHSGLFGRPAELEILETAARDRGVVGADEMVRSHALQQQHADRLRQFQDLMRGRQPLVTYALIAVNVLIFLMTYFNGGITNADPLIREGAVVPRLVAHGEVWRLFTAMFLHAGVQHILFNMTSLLAVGTLAERLYGSIRFLGIYLGAGLIGSLASVVFGFLDGTPNTAGVGASGAIFGVAGALITIRFQPSEVIPAALRRRVSTTMIPLVALSLVFAYITPYVDNSAHLGGLVGGMVLSFLLPLTRRVTPRGTRTDAVGT